MGCYHSGYSADSYIVFKGLRLNMSAVIDVLNQLGLTWVFQATAAITVAIFIFRYFTKHS
jgi:hypothetical protein